MRTAVALSLFALVFVALTVSTYVQESATIDEPLHLTAGYASLTQHDYRLPTHPPLVKMWAALPLLTMGGVNLDTNSAVWLSMNSGELSHKFLYQDNDADRLLYAGRFMIVLLGVLLGGVLFGWARRLYGFWPAVVVLGLYATEPNIVAHAGLVTTDFGVTCFMFIALYFLWRTARELTLKNVSGLLVFFTLAQVSKFSALALWPMLLLLLLIPLMRNSPWPCHVCAGRELATRMSRTLMASLIAALLLLGSFIGIWAVYSFRYSPAPDGQSTTEQLSRSVLLQHLPQLGRVMDWVDGHHLLPNACTHSFVQCQESARKHPSFLAGQISRAGWWWYFPVAFLVKTPAALILLFLGGLTLAFVKRQRIIDDDLFIWVPPAVYLVIAMSSSLNIGLRHILPVYPFVLLIAGKAIARLWMSRRKMLHLGLAALVLSQLDEVAFAYPHYLAFFNQFIGGPQNGYKYLADSNLDWGQDLKLLKKWMDKNRVPFINLSYFGSADPAYYGINYAHLPPFPTFATTGNDPPRFPGYAALSLQNLFLLSANPARPDLYQKMLEEEPVAIIGCSIRVYWVERPWW